jgi:hypothetical protein
MDATAILTVSGFALTATALLRWAGVPSRWGAPTSALVSLIGVAVWTLSQEASVDRTWTFGLLAGWVTITSTAAGVYGFVKDAMTPRERKERG